MPEMQKGKCERCGKWAGDLPDYCAVCSKDLCADCMAKGCCGNVPAKSGQQEDCSDEVMARILSRRKPTV